MRPSWKNRKLIKYLFAFVYERFAVFLVYAGNNGYGLADYELYVPKDWFCDSFETLRKECRLPEEKVFFTKNEIALTLINKVLQSGLLQVWIGAPKNVLFFPRSLCL